MKTYRKNSGEKVQLGKPEVHKKFLKYRLNLSWKLSEDTITNI